MKTTDDYGGAAAAIAAEARRLGGGMVVASGHLGAVLGWPTDTPEGEARLLDFAEANRLDVEHDGKDGFRLAVRPGRRPPTTDHGPPTTDPTRETPTPWLTTRA